SLAMPRRLLPMLTISMTVTRSRRITCLSIASSRACGSALGVHEAQDEDRLWWRRYAKLTAISGQEEPVRSRWLAAACHHAVGGACWESQNGPAAVPGRSDPIAIGSQRLSGGLQARRAGNELHDVTD